MFFALPPRLTRWYRIRKTVYALDKLDDRLLSDLGMDREGIAEQARTAVGNEMEPRRR